MLMLVNSPYHITSNLFLRCISVKIFHHPYQGMSGMNMGRKTCQSSVFQMAYLFVMWLLNLQRFTYSFWPCNCEWGKDFTSYETFQCFVTDLGWTSWLSEVSNWTNEADLEVRCVLWSCCIINVRLAFSHLTFTSLHLFSKSVTNL